MAQQEAASRRGSLTPRAKIVSEQLYKPGDTRSSTKGAHREGVARHFDRLNAFVDRGWMGKLPQMPENVWLVYHRCANGQGIAWPSAELIAARIGHENIAHIGPIRKELVRLGLLVLVEKARGHHPAKYMVCVPESTDSVGSECSEYTDSVDSGMSPEHTDSGGSEAPESPDSVDSSESAESTDSVSQSIPNRLEPPAPPNKEEQTYEGNIKRPASAGAASPLPVAGTPGASAPGNGTLFADGGQPANDQAKGKGRKSRAGEGDRHFREATDWWVRTWSDANNGQKYPFGAKDGKATSEILKALGNDLVKFQAVASLYLRDRDPFYEGHSLCLLRSQLSKFLSRFAAQANGGTHANRSPADRGTEWNGQNRPKPRITYA